MNADDPMDKLLVALSLMAEGRGGAVVRARWAQFFTPPAVARFMARWVHVERCAPLRVLDLGAGLGILGLAVAVDALARGAASVHLTAVEAEPETVALLHDALAQAAARLGDRLRYEVVNADLLATGLAETGFDVVISNPPYFKIRPTSPWHTPNAYARFMEIGAEALRPGGQLLFIVPRSYMSGFYFEIFRENLQEHMQLERVHLFDARDAVFRADRVLQENVIVGYLKARPSYADRLARPIRMSRSAGLADLDAAPPFDAPYKAIFPTVFMEGTLHLPCDAAEAALVVAVQRLHARLASLHLDVTTGPVVPFRTAALRAEAGPDTVPMIWMQHVRHETLTWPLGARCRKPEHLDAPVAPWLLVPNQVMVLVRRFTTKEERTRIQVAVLDGDNPQAKNLGLENHLNYIHYIHWPTHSLDLTLAWGVAAWLGSAAIDRYFRLANGNTQVSAIELRRLPMPGEATLRDLGETMRTAGRAAADAQVEALLEVQALRS